MAVVHLVACHHGFMGYSGHLASITKQLDTLNSEKNGDVRLVILNSQVNNWFLTMDGIDVCGRRFADDIRAALQKLRKEKPLEGRNQPGNEQEPLLQNGAHDSGFGEQQQVIRLSVIGFSLGGLIGRYALGVLYEAGDLEGITLKSFITFATPHLGSRKLPSVIGTLFNYITPRVCSRTGEQLLLEDHDHNHGCPLLLLMSLEDTPFMKVLAKFEHRKLYANALYDRTVSYCSASITKSNPYRKGPFKSVDPTYPHIVEIDENALKPEAFKEHWSTVAIFSSLGLLLPVAGPIALLALQGFALKSKHRVAGLSMIGSTDQPDNVKNLNITHPLGSSDLRELREEQRQLSFRQEIIDNLAKLAWIRVDVVIPALNSHELVVVQYRDPISLFLENGMDVIRQMCDTFSL